MSFVRLFVACTLGLALAYAGLVTLVNPRREFGPTSFPEVIPNSRGMKLVYFDAYNREAPVRGLLMGSSTSMQLDPGTFERLTGVRFFNASVFAGRPEDQLAIYRVLRRRGAGVRQIILGLDLLSFDPHLPVAGDFTDNIDLRSALAGTAPTALERAVEKGMEYKRAMSFDYALDLLTSLKVAVRPVPPEHAFRPNGLIHSPRWDAARAAGTYDLSEKVDRCSEGVLPAVARYNHLDSARVRQTEDLLQETLRDSVSVVLWLPPFHPRLSSAIARAPPSAANAARARSFIEDLARRHHVPLVDLTSLDSFHADTTHWFDCIHYGPDDADRIAAVLAHHDSQF